MSEPSAVTTIATRERVRALLAEGCSQNEIARRLGVSKSTVAYHARRLGKTPDDRCNRRYDWLEVQKFYDAGNGVTACIERFGFSRATWHEAVKRGAVVSRPQAMPIGQLLVGRRHRSHVKLRLLRSGHLGDRCDLCGIDEWQGLPLALCLHHVNGVGDDNRLENLQLLCPNCHSQTDNFSGRNRGRVRRAT